MLDYRAWHAVEVIILGPTPARSDRLAARAKLSQGETRFVSYVTLFAAVDAYLSGLPDTARALRLMLLDDAFAKVDDRTIGELMGLLVRLDVDFAMTGHALWGCYPQVPALDVYEVRRREGTAAVTTHVHWDGRTRHLRARAMTTSTAALRISDELRRYLERRVSRRSVGCGPHAAGAQWVDGRWPADGAARRSRRATGSAACSAHRCVPARSKVRLAALDAALRRSAAAAGLVTVTGAVTGTPLVDRRAQRAARAESWVQVWEAFETRLAAAGLADAPWTPAYLEAIRRSGLLTRAGVEAALTAVDACDGDARRTRSAWPTDRAYG